jgi:U3 small nucleolar RNA-associated protein 22
LERFLQKLHTFLISLPAINPNHPLRAAEALAAASSSSRKKAKKETSSTSVKPIWVPYPAPLPVESTQWTVAFERPSEITLFGSWANKLGVKGRDGARFGVDLAVEMPASLFQEKDYLNNRFFHKRAFYLACIASALSSAESGFNVDVLYECSSADQRLTTLAIRPRKGVDWLIIPLMRI